MDRNNIGFYIDAPHFFAGGDIERGRVVRVAPIIAYMCGWSARQVKDYCDKKGWKVARLKEAS